MYIPNANRVDDREQLLAFMKAHSFATLVSQVDGEPFATHLPILIRQEGEEIWLSSHLAKANPHWKALQDSTALIIFQGPHAYISPTLYEKYESVPTWNYIAVHAYGRPELVEVEQDPARVEQMLRTMMRTYERSYELQWDQLSDTFRQGMLRGVVGFEMLVTRLEGKYKLSQNRSALDRQTVREALANSGDPAIAAIGHAMEQFH
jgi:transcriptional regulator